MSEEQTTVDAAPDNAADEPRHDEDYITIPKETFTQRLERAKRVAVKEYKENLAEKLGLAPDELEDAVNELKSLKEQQEEREREAQIERERLENEISTVKEEKAALLAAKEAEVTQLRGQYHDRLITSTLKEALETAGCPDFARNDALFALDRLPNIRFVVDENEQVIVQDSTGTPVEDKNENGVGTVVRRFVSERPHFQGGSGTRGSGISGHGGTVATAQDLLQRAASDKESRLRAANALKGRG